MRVYHLIKILNPSLLAILLLVLAFLALRPAQAAPSSRPLLTNIVVTTTIQAAINAASPGDTVIVPAGTYTESLTLSKAVSLTGVSSTTTIIHALPNQRVLTVTGATINNSVVISGLTLTGGNVTNNSGGGILISGAAQPLLQSLIIANNQAHSGGGIYVTTGSPLTLTNVIIISNTTLVNSGGGINAQINSPLTLIDTNFVGNSAAFGGGGAFVSDATIINSRFEKNTAAFSGGGIVVTETLNLINSVFVSNTASNAGGGISANKVTLTGSLFQENFTGNQGGGLFTVNKLLLTGTQFIRNRANQGGGIYNISDNAQVINALFVGNTVTDTGAAFYNSNSDVKILHTTVADTSLNSKAAITVISSTVGVTNTIIASHTVGISRTAGTVYEDYNLFFSVPTTSAGTITHGGHSLAGDPKFVAPASDNYHLGAGSTALNAAFPGLAGTDFEGDIRPLGSGSDIGFDESGDDTPGFDSYLPLIFKN